jgi:hypothetical protein
VFAELHAPGQFTPTLFYSATSHLVRLRGSVFVPYLGMLPTGVSSMRKVTEYKDHAKACRDLATRATLPSDKKILEELAQAWEWIAKLRKSDLPDDLRD